MKTKILRSAAALPLLAVASPALASSTVDTDSTDKDRVVVIGHPDAVGTAPEAQGPAGMMGDHVPHVGEFMLGLTWSHERHDGANYTGTRKASDAEIAAAGFTVRAKSMTMDMVMAHVMYAPNERITLMAMPMWMRMEMTMLGIAMPPMGTDHVGHHTLMPGETMTHAVSGIGDTKLGALVALSRAPKLSAHAGLLVSAPTGSVSRKNDDGSYVHYGMQPGSGTWDLEPSLTLRGKLTDRLSWGAQASGVIRLDHTNRSGYALGDRVAASVWTAARLDDRFSLSARLSYSDQGKIRGHYDGPHNHLSPPDRQANYGGQMVEAGLGANAVIARGLTLGAEANLPIHQDLNGFQLRKDFGLNFNISQTF